MQVISLPTGWNHATIEDLCRFESGTGFGPADWKDSGLPIIRIQNLNGSRDFNYFAGMADPAWLVEPGDLLFAWAGVKGVSFGPAIWNGPQGVLNQHIYRIRPKVEVDLVWLFHQLLNVTAAIESSAHGFKSSLVHVRKSDITRQDCYVPPLQEQRAIASVMTTWDRGVQQISDLINAKSHFKRGLMEQMLSGASRFRNFKDEWYSARLSDVTEECAERNRGRMGLESVMAVTKADGIVPMREKTIGASIDRYLVVQKNCFAYNPMRINIGSIARSQGDKDVLVSPDYVVFRCKEESKDVPGLDPDFLDHFRRSKLWEKFVMATGNGSVRIRIYYSELSRLKLNLPSLAEQKKIAKLLNTMDREIELLRKQLELLKLQKKGLMQKLLTGRVRVKLPKGAK